MPWNPLSLYASGQVPNVDELNRASDNLRSLRRFNDHGVKLYISDDQDIPDATVTKIIWDSQVFGFGSIWEPGFPTRLTAPVSGQYLVLVNIEWRSDTSGERTTGLTKSAGVLRIDLSSQGASQGGGNQSAMEILHLNAGEYVEPHVYQSSGGTIAVHGGSQDRTSVDMWLLGV